MSSSSTNYNPVPPRFWYRVENSCVYPPPPNLTDYTVYIPLTKQNVTPLQAQYEEQMLLKGNILQYKNNSANLTKKQKYSQIAKGFNNSRKKCYATQSQTYTNPNTSSLLRVNYVNIPFPNEILNSPNNISGPFQYNLQQPFNCPTNILQDGGNLVCNKIVNPCTGQVIETFTNNICYPTTCSDVPGNPIELCWPNIQTWYPRQRYKMNNSANKWPYNYKGFVSAVRPSAPILALLAVNLNSVEISWAINVCYLLPISSFNIYVNNVLFINILNNNSFTATLNNLNENDSIYITSLSTTIEFEPSNIIYVSPYVDNNNIIVDGNGGEPGDDNPGDGEIYINPDTASLLYINKLTNDNTISQINTYLLTYNTTITNPDDKTTMTIDTFNELNMGLINLYNDINKYKDGDTKSHLQTIVEHYKNLLSCLKYAFDKKFEYFSLVQMSEKWSLDSSILNNAALLNDYIKQLNISNKQGILGKFSLTAPLLKVKPEYLEYAKMYGVPSDGRYDPGLLLEIINKLDSAINVNITPSDLLEAQKGLASAITLTERQYKLT
jgi:hypothetical protein